jgi:hypothetical protein
MTFHIALSAAAGSVMLSDSQGTTEASEIHGLQKQYVGDSFLVGGAGSSVVLNALFDTLSAGSAPRGGDALTALVEGFFEREVRPGALAQAEVLIVTPDAGGKTVQRLVPAALTRFGRRGEMGAIGSGASFATRAVQRDHAIGVEWSMGSLADMLVFAYDCADAANESVTVNDELMAGFLMGDRAYAMGDEAIKLTHIPREILNNWRFVSDYYNEEILPLVRSIRDARRFAYRAFSGLLMPEPDAGTRDAIAAHLAIVAAGVPALSARLAEFFAQYDGYLGRGG